jgi:two-component system chemotaxis response regulator CheB
MPGAAWKLGAAGEKLPLEQIAARLLVLAQQPTVSARRAAS